MDESLKFKEIAAVYNEVSYYYHEQQTMRIVRESIDQ